MKKISIYSLLLFTILFAGCTKFLDLPPKNQRAVETLTDVKSSLAGYLDALKTKFTQPMIGSYPLLTADQIMMFEAYADNIDFQATMPHFINPSNLHKKEEFYADKLLWNDMETPESIWKNYYTTIGFLNALIDQMALIEDGAADERDRVLGEMLVHRAFYFFKLLQYFAPYDNAELGIPVYLHSGDQVVGVRMERKPQADVYAVILEDLSKALQLVNQSEPRETFNVFYNKRYIHNLTAQVYWFKAASAAAEDSDYAAAKEHSAAAVEGVSGYIPTTTEEINLTAQGVNTQYPAFFQAGNSYGGIAAIYGSTWDYIGYEPALIWIEEDLLTLFSDDDIRKAAYFTGNAKNSAWPDGRAYGTKYAHFYLFKPEEAYLILAEAQYRLGETADAVTTLNTFKSFRNAGTATGLTGDALLQEIVNERRKEFFADSDKRWLDLKRYGNKTITRSVRFFDKDYNLTVSPGGYQYALQIPLSEMQENPNIVPNEGWTPIIY